MAAKGVSLAKYNAMARKISSMQKRAKRVKSVADEKVQYAVRVAEVGAAATTMGVIQGMKNKTAKEKGEEPKPWEIYNVPAPLLIGAGLHAAGLFGVGGDMAGHMHAFGDGCLAVGLYQIGSDLGQSGLKGLKEGFGVSGEFDSYTQLGGQRLSDAELEMLYKNR